MSSKNAFINYSFGSYEGGFKNGKWNKQGIIRFHETKNYAIFQYPKFKKMLIVNKETQNKNDEHSLQLIPV